MTPTPFVSGLRAFCAALDKSLTLPPLRAKSYGTAGALLQPLPAAMLRPSERHTGRLRSGTDASRSASPVRAPKRAGEAAYVPRRVQRDRLREDLCPHHAIGLTQKTATQEGCPRRGCGFLRRINWTKHNARRASALSPAYRRPAK